MIDKKRYMDEIEHALKDHGVEFSKHEGWLKTCLSVSGKLNCSWINSKEYMLCFCVSDNLVFSLIGVKNLDVDAIVKSIERPFSDQEFRERSVSYLWEKNRFFGVIKYLHREESADCLVENALNDFELVNNRAKTIAKQIFKWEIAINATKAVIEEVLGTKDCLERVDEVEEAQGYLFCNLDSGVLFVNVEPSDASFPSLVLKFKKHNSKKFNFQFQDVFDADFDVKQVIEDFISMVSKKIFIKVIRSGQKVVIL